MTTINRHRTKRIRGQQKSPKVKNARKDYYMTETALDIIETHKALGYNSKSALVNAAVLQLAKQIKA